MTTDAPRGRLGILTALRHREFRTYWTGFVTAVSGMQMFQVIQVWLVYDLTNSPLQLGFLGLARAAPAVILGLAGGVIADKVDQRKLLLVTTTGVAAVYAVLGTLTLTGVIQVWHILVAVFIVGGLQAFDQPSRQAIFPHLIDRKDMMSAVALNSTVHPGTRIFAPLIAGLFIDFVGVPRVGAAIGIYVVGLTYLVFSGQLLRVRMPAVARAKGGGGFQDLANGMRYISARPVFRLLITTSFVNAFFGMSHVILFPVFAEALLGSASGGAVSIMFSAAGLGGLMGAIIGGSMGAIRRRGWLVVGGAGGFGILTIAFALAPIFWLAVVLEWLASVSHQLFMVTSQSTLHMQLDDEYRGRVMGVWGMTHSVMQPFGMLAMGGLGNAVSASFAVIVGGGIVAAFALLGAGRDSRVRNLGPEEPAVEPRQAEPQQQAVGSAGGD